jgi:hypothetical protein
MRYASRLNRIAGCLAILLLAVSWIPAAVAADILYVANVPLNPADQSIVDYVRAKGHYVLVVDDSAAVPDTTTTELIMISESVDPAVVGTKFNTIPRVGCRNAVCARHDRSHSGHGFWLFNR